MSCFKKLLLIQRERGERGERDSLSLHRSKSPHPALPDLHLQTQSSRCHMFEHRIHVCQSSKEYRALSSAKKNLGKAWVRRQGVRENSTEKESRQGREAYQGGFMQCECTLFVYLMEIKWRNWCLFELALKSIMSARSTKMSWHRRADLNRWHCLSTRA